MARKTRCCDELEKLCLILITQTLLKTGQLSRANRRCLVLSFTRDPSSRLIKVEAVVLVFSALVGNTHHQYEQRQGKVSNHLSVGLLS